ncbi:glycosyltransferase family 2 protein [Marine Group I thaumarchaeote]|jgi:dolichol-phosphate mannosyltransferase|uniref:Dolichol-phosphate mannosyltransferase n=1 Tax=Marine Group I thaumarchaeote TaxID=2511932 RepID=A0A7K4NJJ0_9ARCH|nr:MAG: glycosyltransferase family 2 protein [Nitrosopumilus sp. YT1]NMI82432.1 glycosyltransferase family 2 protein [Candidatus Nitrosopumilus sp. MTA1]NWJ20539.1 glycosyltransferase family 2 protein [Marine Group I thaumarchaeote]NWJ56554.1 glycosyltransferase family 2 protein [Marine Group I thaumarchaeote]NWJ83177.1 glycosyltransferase family 2 protein [Marine Group I thaumarchaeote]
MQSNESLQENNAQISIIIPTYNESQNILQILKSIKDNLPKNFVTQTIVVDDNSPDGTGKLVEDYLKNIKKMADYTIEIIHRKAKDGLSSAILKGIQHAKGDTIVVMDCDFSHPPHIIPKLIESIKKYQYDIVVASRYIKGGKIQGWSLKRKTMSKFATLIAKKGLGINTHDPMSGFFAFKRNIIKGLNIDAIGYKFLLEILVKTKDVSIKEIPYTFQNRELGSSKLSIRTIFDYYRSVWKLYRYGKPLEKQEKRSSVKFLYKAGRFYTVGASGFIVNYMISLLLTGGVSDLWYLHANVIGIIASITTNFVLNKTWTFGDRDFRLKKTISQYGKFAMFSSLGALVQLGMVYFLVDSNEISYPLALILAVMTAAFGNFILNKKFTFKEKLLG